MIIQTVNQSFNTMTTKVTQPTGEATLCESQGLQLMWDATVKWFKWIPVGGENYNTGYLSVNSNMVSEGMFPPVNERDLTAGSAVWIDSDPTQIPSSSLGTNSYSSLSGIISFLETDLTAKCDLIFSIHLNLNSPDGTAASLTADSFITSFVQIAQWV